MATNIQCIPRRSTGNQHSVHSYEIYRQPTFSAFLQDLQATNIQCIPTRSTGNHHSVHSYKIYKQPTFSAFLQDLQATNIQCIPTRSTGNQHHFTLQNLQPANVLSTLSTSTAN
ncbi:hypothetical protein BsWGS_13072 [Bradybaena similaris]